MIRELIVVEGKNDAHAVRRALGRDVEILWTEGFGLNQKTLELIRKAAHSRGVIVFTDPDTVGEQIRERIRRSVPEAKHVYLSKRDARYKQDIGIEHATPETIREAFAHIQVSNIQAKADPIFTMDDLYELKLVGFPDSARRRTELGKRLGIGDANAKQFLKRLNSFGLSKEQLLSALKELT